MDSDEDQANCDSGEEQPPAKKPRSAAGKNVVRGAAYYKTKFNKEWMKKYPYIQVVKSDPHSFLCTICNKKISCKHQGETDVTRHIAGVAHTCLAQQMESQSRLTFPLTSSPLAMKVSLSTCIIMLHSKQ